MEIYAKTEARRLLLYHLASLFFHERAEYLTVREKESEELYELQLSDPKHQSVGRAFIDTTRHLDQKRALEAAVGLAFARAAKNLTEYCPPYGTLVGVRPVKVPLFYLRAGLDEAAVLSLLRDDFYVSDNKAALLLALAKKELAFARGYSDRDAMLYLSIPFCPSRCSYCSFISSAAPNHLDRIGEYLTLLQTEICETATLFRESDRVLRAVYIGGGTPGILSAEQLQALLSQIKEQFSTECVEEFCVELGRPDTITEEKLLVCREHGVDRISINPQTTNDQTLSRIGRGHSAEDFFRAMELAGRVSFDSINCDLIAALPDEKPETFLCSVRDVLSLKPQSVTIHALCRKKSASEALPLLSDGFREAVDEAHEACIKQALVPYYLYRQKSAAADLENVGFSLPDRVGIYNLAMMEDLVDIVSCGAGAISKIIPKKEGGRILRFAQNKYPFEYLSHPEKIKARLDAMKACWQEESEKI